MKINIIRVAKKQSSLNDYFDEYKKKISHFVKIDFILIKPLSFSRSQSLKKKTDESAKIIRSLLSNPGMNILLDENGSKYTSEVFSKELTQHLEISKNINFIIGGAFGVTDDLKKICPIKISLSTLVYNHEVAFAVLLEQIYRGFCIKNNIPYHNGS